MLKILAEYIEQRRTLLKKANTLNLAWCDEDREEFFRTADTAWGEELMLRQISDLLEGKPLATEDWLTKFISKKEKEEAEYLLWEETQRGPTP